MRPFNWEELFREQRIPYVERGANVKRGEIAIKCPFCGSADPSEHMGINLETGWWSCWRNRAQHSGKSPLRLIMRLLLVPYAKAREIAGLDDSYVDPEGFDALAAQIMGRNLITPEKQEARRFLDLDPDFTPISSKIRTRRHWNYLYARGFNRTRKGIDDVDALVEDYGLMAGQGKWNDRIVIPFLQDGVLVTWTARAIGPSHMRYRDLSIEESLVAPKHTLFNHDAMLRGGQALVLVEGPFDALKLDYYGKPFGVRAVALCTNSITEDQAFLLKSAEGKFRSTIVMMDNKTDFGLVDSMRMKADLCFIDNLKIEPTPFGYGDPGDMDPGAVIDWARTK